jgi:F-type H+-transporting ATPase subunit alpha
MLNAIVGDKVIIPYEVKKRIKFLEKNKKKIKIKINYTYKGRFTDGEMKDYITYLNYINYDKDKNDKISNTRKMMIKGEIGRVIKISDGIIRINGLSQIGANEMINVGTLMGVALNLEVNTVGALIFGSDRYVNAKNYVFRTKKLLSVPVGFALLGRVIDSLGRPIDGKGTINVE